MKAYLKGFLAAISLSAIVACATNPITGKRSFVMVPESVEISMGEQSYSQVLRSEPISNDPKWNAIVTRVGQRIAAVANRPDYQWEFKVIASNVQNAFCLPGGKIAVYKGILPIAKNEAGLATVMSHEVVHAIARHGGQRISQGLLATGALIGLQQTALKDKDAKTQALILGGLGAGLTVGVILPFSRGHESEADEVGQILMARAGYDPSESIQFWHRFAEVTKGSSMPTFLSTHPSTTSREEAMREHLSAAQAEYAKAPNKYGIGEVF